MATRYQQLIASKHDLGVEAEALMAKETLTAEEDTRLTAIATDLKDVNAKISTEEAVRAELRGGPAHFIAPEINGDTLNQPEATAKTTPFKSLGEQLQAVAFAGRNPHAVPTALLDVNAAATGSSEGVQSDGGFLVQSDFQTELLTLTHDASVLYAKTDNTPIGANSNGLRINAVDETSRADGSRWGGVLAYWVGEATTPTQTKPKFRQMEMTLQKLMGLYYATDELLNDASALGSVISTAFSEEFGFKVDDAIFRGTGAGMPLGVLGHASVVSVSKETGQAALTIVLENIQKMYARMWARSIGKGEWYINQDCWPQIFALSQVVGVGGVPVFLPPGGISGAPFGSLLGRPITPIEQSATLGTVGDILFGDFSQYKTIDKGAMESASSIHVQFLTDETVFRFILRMDGQPKRNAALTPFKGTATQSSFVTLATRA